MTTNATEVLKEFVTNLLTDRDFAFRYAEDPSGTLAAQGVTDVDLSAVDVPAVVGDAADAPDVSDEARTALQSYTGGSAGGGSGVGSGVGSVGGSAGGSAAGVPSAAATGTQSVEQVVQHLNYVTFATYEGDDFIT